MLFILLIPVWTMLQLGEVFKPFFNNRGHSTDAMVHVKGLYSEYFNFAGIRRPIFRDDHTMIHCYASEAPPAGRSSNQQQHSTAGYFPENGAVGMCPKINKIEIFPAIP